MGVRRVTAREFQKRFQRIEEPVLVNDGIWFPKATPAAIALAEGRLTIEFDVTAHHTLPDGTLVVDEAKDPKIITEEEI